MVPVGTFQMNLKVIADALKVVFETRARRGSRLRIHPSSIDGALGAIWPFVRGLRHINISTIIEMS